MIIFIMRRSLMLARRSRNSGSFRRVRESKDVRSAFTGEGFSKYYLLALTNEKFEEMSGYELAEGEYRIGDDTVAGPIVGFAIAKAAFAEELADSNLDYLNIVETKDGIRFGELAGSRDDFYPVDIKEIEDIVG